MPVPRRVYPYSIVPGGVANRAELVSAVRSDRVVSEHYATFDVAKAHPVTVAKARAVHVSYRKGDKVYWTSKKIMLVEGETLLSDGANEMRARCANRISDVAQFPVNADEPSAEVLDAAFEGTLNEDVSAALVQASGPAFGEDAPSVDGNAGISTSSQSQSVGIEGELDRPARWESASPGMVVARGASQPDPRPFIPQAVPVPQAPVAGIDPDQPAPADIPEPGTLWLVAGALALWRLAARRAP